MRRILFVSNTMGRAGAEKALVSLLQSLDYSRAAVTLLSIVNRGEMFAEVPPQVEVRNRNPSDKAVLGVGGSAYLARKILAKLVRGGYLLRYLPYAVRNARLQLSMGRFGWDKLFWLLLADAAPPDAREYDLAVAFLEGAATYYVANRVTAKRKLAVVHINYQKAGYCAALDRDYYEKFDVICGVSDAVTAQFAAVFPAFAPRLHTLPNVVNRAEILAGAGEPGGFDDGYDGTRIVTVARLHPQKGIDLAVDALALLVRAGYGGVRWYVIGDGNERGRLTKRIERSGLRGKFILLGGRSNPYPFVRQADVYVQPSRFEGLSIALTEALLLGKPVVTTDCDGLDGWLTHGENALIAAPETAAIAAAVRAVLDDGALRARLADGAGRVNLAAGNSVAALHRLADGEGWGEQAR